MVKHTLKVFFLIFFFFIFSSPVSAKVVINEFLVNPTSPAQEWIEFYNPEHTDLTTYWLDDDTSFTEDSGNSDKKSLSSLNTNSLDYPYLEFSSFLNNDGDYVVLFANDGSIIDQYHYTSDPGKDISVGRSPDGADNWITFASPTFGSSNGSSSSISYPSNIYLSEFMPNPAEGQEWVELYNDNDSLADLSGWKIDDIEGGSSPQHFNGQIPAKSYFVIFIENDAKLNNDGDSVRLIRPDDSEADKATYNSSQDGVSWAKDGGEWLETQTPTPGSANKITSSTSDQESTSTTSPSSTTTSSPKPTSIAKKETAQKTYQTDTPQYDWEQSENSTPEPSVISLVLGEETENPIRKIPLHILFIFAGLLFFTAAFFPQIKTKLQDFYEERFQKPM